MKDLLQKYVSNRREKICHYQKCLKIRLKNSFNYPENLFPLTGIARVSEKKEKNGFDKPENQLPLARIRLLFKNWISQFPIAQKKFSE